MFDKKEYNRLWKQKNKEKQRGYEDKYNKSEKRKKAVRWEGINIIQTILVL